MCRQAANDYKFALLSIYIKSIDNVTSRPWRVCVLLKTQHPFYGWPGSPQDNKMYSHDHKLTPCICNVNASILQLFLWMAKYDEHAKKTILPLYDQRFCLSTVDIRRILFTVGPFAGPDNILGSPYSISLSQMVICACFETIPGLKNPTMPYL